MKKYLVCFTVCAAIFAAGCTDFGEENKQLSLSDAPAIEISGVVAEEEGESITFTVAPTGTAGYYSWVVVESELADSTVQADQVLKLQTAGVVNGIIHYTDTTKSKTITVNGLTPFTVYQIYAVASNADGIVGKVKNTQIRTLDDSSKPTPQSVGLEGNVVTLAFHEPLQLGTGKVFVSYFAKNTFSSTIAPEVKEGFESFNPQDIEVPTDSLSIKDNALIIKLPSAPAGAYASITYNAGAVSDLSGNGSSAYTNKADTLIGGAPSRGITVQLANKAWALHGEFEAVNPDTLAAFVTWDELVISAFPDEGITVAKTGAVTPTMIYHENGKKSIIDVTTWGAISGIPAFMLTEEPARGATVDLDIPADAYEDVYGNTSGALLVEGNYIYSYGYTFADVVGTYSIALVSYFDGPLSETGIVVEEIEGSENVAIKNLLMPDTEIRGVFDPVLGTITINEQIIATEVDFGTNGVHDMLFTNASTDAPVVFNVPSSGIITSPAQLWGYYIADLGWYDVFSESTWTQDATASASKVAKATLKRTIHKSPSVGNFRR